VGEGKHYTHEEKMSKERWKREQTWWPWKRRKI